MRKHSPRLLLFWSLLVVSLRDDGGEGRPLPLPRQHLVFNFPDLLLEVPGLGRDGLPDWGVPHSALSLAGSTESLLAWRGDIKLLPVFSSYPSERWCSWTRTWPFVWEWCSGCTDPWTWWWPSRGTTRNSGSKYISASSQDSVTFLTLDINYWKLSCISAKKAF